MIHLLLQHQRRKVTRLSGSITHNRQVLKILRTETRETLEKQAQGGWALLGCFVSGLLVGRVGGKGMSALRTLPLMNFARQLWAHLLV
ncbi:hypothetical protein [Marinimicrobium sp. ARAG 43.8]|uniref:hypothetical protein n=1 Tax=Marinimicrobium sp. ARAG 43.8 TaxID=3418719 RepID=UPI003CE8EDC0